MRRLTDGEINIILGTIFMIVAMVGVRGIQGAFLVSMGMATFNLGVYLYENERGRNDRQSIRILSKGRSKRE